MVGVAGHIDHGKTTLVKALTGTDTDRLPEEKSRGITIELGFAVMTLEGGLRASVIDMPGHERFVRAMISGAGGVDLLLLVIAANEGVMPQTREHLAIAKLMGVGAVVCALTKCDLAGEEISALAAEEAREVMASAGFLSAPVVPVSAVTGEGIEALREAIAREELSTRDDTGPVLLPVDRVFVRRGFGVVVTGTLLGGVIAEGDTLGVGPIGAEHGVKTVRVRGLQVHGESARRVSAGVRVAVNLAGVELAEIARGTWVFTQNVIALSRSFDVEVSLLSRTKRALGRRTKLELAVGAAHALATVNLLEGEALLPGHSALARVLTDRPLAVRWGERGVLCGPPSLAAEGSTVGGVFVLRPEAERVRRRVVAAERARAMQTTDVARRARAVLSVAGARGLSGSELIARAGYSITDDKDCTDTAVRVASDRWVSLSVVQDTEAKVLAALSAHHGARPEERGLDRRGLSAVGDDFLVGMALERLASRREIVRDGELWARAGWRARTADEVPFLGSIRAELQRTGLAPPRPTELAAKMGADLKSVETVLRKLLDRREVVKVNAELWVDAEALSALEKTLIEYLRREGSIDPQGFKAVTAQTRKYAIPYAEYFDAKKITLRVGDRRKLRGG